MYKGVSVNVDFYSGFVYDMLGLPHELYTPAVRNSAHSRLECSPNRRTAERRKNYPPRVYERTAPQRLQAYRRKISLTPFRAD